VNSFTKNIWKYKNHNDAELFPYKIACYLGKEKYNKSIIRPFNFNIFSDSMKISSLNSVPKKYTSGRRVNVYLSFPKDAAGT
jgi:hypothetical protein